MYNTSVHLYIYPLHGNSLLLNWNNLLVWLLPVATKLHVEKNFILCILYWTGANQRLRCGYTAVVFCSYCAYSFELVQSRDWDVFILQLSSVYIVHTVLNCCKAKNEMRLYCSCLLFILCILYWTGAKRRLRCGYNAAIFCLYCAYCIELVQRGDWDVVILQLSSVYIVHTVLNCCKAETKMWLYCSCLLFILCILYWIGAKRRLRCGYTEAVFC